jgi:two-component system, NarL family, sensor histidine kinase EvgS
MAGYFPFTFSYRRTIFNFVGTRALRFCASLTVIVIFCSTTLLAGEQSSKLDPTSIQLKQHALQLADSNAVGNNSPYTLKPTHNVAVALTTEEKAWIQGHPVVLFGAERDWPPFDFVDQEGKHLGFSSDMLQLISKHSGLSFRPEVDTWSALLKKVKAKKIDVLPAIFETEERKPYLNFTEPYQQILPYFFINDAVSATTLEDLNGKTIAIPKDFAQVKKVKQQFPKLRVLETETLMGAIQAVIERKADVILETYPVINYVLKQNGITSIRPFKPIALGDTWELRMAVRKDMPLLHSIINKTMATIPAKEKQQLTDKWLGYLENQDDRQFQLTNPERQWLSAHPVIRFTGDPNWLPYEAFDSKGRYVGMVADYLRVLEKKLPIKFDIVPSKTWDESINLVKRNEVDVLSATIEYPDLQTSLGFTQAYLSSPIVIVMRDQEDYVDSIDEIKHRRIAVLKDYGHNLIIFRKYPNIKFIEFDTVEQGLTAVSTGQVDALLSTLAQATYHISSLGMNNVRIVGKSEFITHVGFGVRKELAPLVPLLNRALNNISAKEKQAISDQWGKDCVF